MLRQRSRAPYARQRTDRAARWADDRCSSQLAENTIMRADRKLLVLGVTLAGAIVGAMSVLIGEVQRSGFVSSQVQIDQAIAIARNVAGVTGVGNEMSIKK